MSGGLVSRASEVRALSPLFPSPPKPLVPAIPDSNVTRGLEIRSAPEFGRTARIGEVDTQTCAQTYRKTRSSVGYINPGLQPA
jgi:hypothetical protein